jgi:dynein light chain roadblock-type
VIGTIVVNNEGVPIKSTLDNATTVQYSGLLNNLVDQVLSLERTDLAQNGKMVL